MTPEQRAARERKQKIFVVVGGLLLLAMLAFQLPKLMGGGGSSSSAATTETTTTLPGQVAAPATPGVSPSTSSRTSAALTTPKLTSFTLFKPKDPFVQQVATENGVESTGTPGEAAGKGPGAGAKGESPTAAFSTGGKAESATIVTVNGARQVLEPGMKFPSADPLFVLVAEKPGAKSVVVGIVGGAYSSGGKTTTLKVGKPLTLVNTTTGARYKISLVSVGSGDQAEQPPAKK